MNEAKKIQKIKECLQEYRNDVDEDGFHLNNITSDEVLTSIEDIIFLWE